MNIQLDPAAVEWYKDEMNLKNGDFVRYFVRYGGCSTVQSGFSLGVTKDEPDDLGIKTELNGITFYIEEKDLWYLDEHSLHVKFNETYQEPVLEFTK